MGSSGPILRLRCAVKNYDWGQIGDGSHVARLAEKNSGEQVDPARPYAEFWMGTHPSGPSYVASHVAGDATSLKDWIQANAAVLGEKVAYTWGPDLPFLFKVTTASLFFLKLLRFAPPIFRFLSLSSLRNLVPPPIISYETDS